ncbi:MAG: hypothetical protein JOY58_06685 [Solirubrobacterales bacterium]|nr:hypothetical protein [Solirubrobacterales bacterium]
MSTLRKYTLAFSAIAVCLAALAMSIVASAGASPINTGPVSNDKPSTLQGQPLHVPGPLRITRIVPSDRVNFDIEAVALHPGRAAEVQGGTSPSFVFNTPSGWTQVTHVGTGHYCLNGGGYNYPAVVSVANRDATVPVGSLVQYDSFGRGCPGVGVFTYQIVH